MVWRYAIIIVAGYLLGNISMGIIISHRYHMDIRQHGSGNAGTTNVLRTLGWLPSALTLLGDALKSFAACMLGKWLAGRHGADGGRTDGRHRPPTGRRSTAFAAARAWRPRWGWCLP